ncbi:uncharacterized protein LOC117314747 isoform X2 [Pecten maximus]|uniref:uncharacterized protein LOC117314747 isoform X2 n=1 Tax=Pecten maximus TaxID=6579 RepID=UPI0014584792|nr:uncharacterized protein LOC117314747 isoform X2 [Pecten maximus]
MFMTPGILSTIVLVLGLYVARLKSSEVYRCPAGLSGTMYTHNSHCYRYVDTTATWDEASADCSSTDGGHLVVILDQSTQNFIASLPFSANTYQIWIGFSDRSQEQHWKWVTGEEWSYDFWYTGYPKLCYGPNDVCPEDCAYMRKSDGRWREDHCNNNHIRYQYICQYDMGPPTTATTKPTTTTTTTTKPTTTTTMTTKPTTTTTTSHTTSKDTTTVLPLTTVTRTTTSTPAITVTMTTEPSTTTEPMVAGMGQLQDGDKSLSTGGLIGLLLMLIILILLILVVLLIIIRRRRKRYEAEDISVRFQNHTYNTNQPNNSFLDGQIGTSVHSVGNIYETPQLKHCNESLYHDKSYETPVNRDTLCCKGQHSHYDLVKESDMVDLPEALYHDKSYETPVSRDTLCYKGQDNHYDLVKESDTVDLPDKYSSYSEVDFQKPGCVDVRSCGVSSRVDDPTYSNDQTEASDPILENRNNEELLRYFEEYNKVPTGYDNNLYVDYKNKPL